jgi:uncharacterized protein (DUF58 family)
MLPAAVMRQIRRLQLRARRAVQTLLGGEYHSVFKGTGLSFEEVREYQPGDDVRSIDWNVTARMGSPFIKRFVEERELTVLLAVDVSGSQRFGTQRHTKRAVAAEVAALIAFSAVANNDRVGLLAVSDEVERFIPPGKGAKHALRVLRDILFYEPRRPGTSLKTAFDFLNQALPRRAIVFFVSDWLDTGYEPAFRLAARKHDLIAVRVSDPREEELPAVGLIEVEDAETGKHFLLDTRRSAVRQAYAAAGARRKAAFTALARSGKVDLIDVSTDGAHFDALVRFFRLRESRRRRGR